MLVLTRRIGEEIVINGNICITVVSLKGERVRIGIAAPESIAVDRKEIHDRRAEFTAATEPATNGYLFYDEQATFVPTARRFVSA